MSGSRGAFLNNGEFPIGWVSYTHFETQQMTLNPKDRLVLYSGGINQLFPEFTNAQSGTHLNPSFEDHANCDLGFVLKNLANKTNHKIHASDDLVILVIERTPLHTVGAK